jgi:hypothetical protein
MEKSPGNTASWTPPQDSIPPGGDPFTVEQIKQLRADLDTSRVRRREGRGGNEFSYLATHDVKRTANEIFGFGNWGHRIVEQHQLAAVPVESRDRQGFHVAWYCRVELTVRGCIPVSGSGYGDGVEYGPAALATAQELAIKESESDALKRALTNFGDQFGLILYAKDDERRRIEADQAPAAARPDADDPIRDWQDLHGRFVAWSDEYDWAQIIRTAATTFYNGGPAVADLPDEQAQQAGVRTREALFWLWENTASPDELPPLAPDDILRAFAHAYEGLALPSDVVQPLPRSTPPPPTTAAGADGEAAAGGSSRGSDELAENGGESLDPEGFEEQHPRGEAGTRGGAA